MHDEQYEAVRKQVVRRLVRQLTFFIHLLFFLLVMLLLVRARGAMGTWFFALLWGVGLLLHASLAFNLFGALIDRATRRELERRGLKEKPKRRRLELGEDGELVEMIEDEDFAPPAEDLQQR